MIGQAIAHNKIAAKLGAGGEGANAEDFHYRRIKE